MNTYYVVNEKWEAKVAMTAPDKGRATAALFIAVHEGLIPAPEGNYLDIVSQARSFPVDIPHIIWAGFNGKGKPVIGKDTMKACIMKADIPKTTPEKK